MSFLNENDALEEFQALSKGAFLVAKCGDNQANEGVSFSASTLTGSEDSTHGGVLLLGPLVLYIKALSLFRDALTAVTVYKEECLQSTKTSTQVSSSTLQKLDSLIECLTDHFQLYFKKSDRLRKHLQDSYGLSPADADDEEDEDEPADGYVVGRRSKSRRPNLGKLGTPESEKLLSIPCGPSAERLIYEWSLKLAKGAAVDEMMGNSVTALQNYRYAFSLLQQLTQESLDSHDLAVLRKIMADLHYRIEAIQADQLPGKI